LARALIVGCGCRGRALGRALIERGWVVRGTTRDEGLTQAIEDDGIEAVVADPDRLGTVLEAIEGVALVYWLLGSATGEPEAVAALHGPRLERMLEEIVDTPVRGFVYEVTGWTESDVLVRALAALKSAGERWRIPFEVVDADPVDLDLWLEGMLGAAEELIGA
jgi:hypothetical protein